MRNAALHHHLERFAVDASGRLAALAASGAELPFELCEEPGRGAASLYCYRPLTAQFIRAHRELLSDVPGHEAAARALGECDALDLYLAAHGEVRIPGDRRGCAELALEVFLRALYSERTDLGFEPASFETAYAELERTIYCDHAVATVIAPVLGVALDPGTTELTLGDGLSLIRGEALAGAPREAVWGDGEEPTVLAVLTVDSEHSPHGAVALARTRFRRVLSALRLLERGAYVMGPMAWARTEGATWRTVPIGVSGRCGHARRLTVVSAGQEEELRAFCRLVSRQGAGGGELAWALARFEMGCERPAPLEALTDHLLALRALLEPEGPTSGRLAQTGRDLCPARATRRARPADRPRDRPRASGDHRDGSAAQPR